MVVRYRPPGLLLTENLPLRTSKLLGAFAEDKPLARRYGDLRKSRVKCVKISPTEYFVADHPFTVTAAQVDNLSTDSFEGKVVSGALGQNYTVVRFAAPVPDTAGVTVSGLGLRHPVTGALMENPADIIEDLSRVANRDDPWWGQLRSDASIAGISLAGSVTEVRSIRSYIDEITESAGAMWCYGMGRLYPTPVIDGYVLGLDRYQVWDLAVTTALTDTADILRLSYAYNEAEGKAGAFIELTASPIRFGKTVAELTLGWVRDAKAAEAIGRRWLGWMAGERYDVAFDAEQSPELRPGTWVHLLAYPTWPYGTDPYIMLTRAALASYGNRAKCGGVTLLSSPTITVTGHTVALSGIRTPGVSITIADGVATFILNDISGKPLVGAYVSLDKGNPKKTDAKGSVTFPAIPGTHLLEVSAAGYDTQQLEIQL